MSPTLSVRLLSLSRIARGNAKGLSAAGCEKLSADLTACAELARLLETDNRALEDELLTAELAATDEEPIPSDPRQLDLTAGEVIVMPRLFPRNYGLGWRGQR